ncbi:Integrator complex subunit 13 [Acanthosepion pharaonis]|uniref:Integrator complex subunit 13 n=1 Tax=Acanthosepion pharaonis TaxID=158019 RepID=A0A812B6S8_ACAPH|nr:Integrator complex subunit 13 [Sepia pharaonis]
MIILSQLSLPINHCELILLHVVPVGDEPKVFDRPKKDLSPLLSTEVRVAQAGRNLYFKLAALVQQHYDLSSTTVTGIPMKEEQNASSSANYDVELLHPAIAHEELKKQTGGHAEGLIIPSKEGLPTETVTLKWCTPKSSVVGELLFFFPSNILQQLFFFSLCDFFFFLSFFNFFLLFSHVFFFLCFSSFSFSCIPFLSTFSSLFLFLLFSFFFFMSLSLSLTRFLEIVNFSPFLYHFLFFFFFLILTVCFSLSFLFIYFLKFISIRYFPSLSFSLFLSILLSTLFLLFLLSVYFVWPSRQHCKPSCY